MSRGPLETVMRHIRMLAGDRPEAGDSQLLQAFIARRDESAFEALLRRHGPGVWCLCRRMLRDAHLAEDAFQATFLVLVRRAGTIRKREALASWLYGVAFRLACSARAQARRRQSREQGGHDMRLDEPAFEPTGSDLQAILDEELARLPAKLRAPLLLCCLEGKTREEAGLELGWTEGMVKGRLEQARELLRGRLARRGLSLSAGALSVALGNL